MSPKKYILLIGSAVFLIALLLIPFFRTADPAADKKIGHPSPDQPTQGDRIINQPTNIYVNVSVSLDQFVLLTQMNRKFMEKYPTIRVTLINEPEEKEAYAQWVAQSQQGAAADIVLLNNGWVKPFAVRGFLKPVESVLSGDALSDQMTALLDPLKWNGYLWAVPKDVNPYIIVWNRPLLLQAGLSLPPFDWNTFQTTAAKVKELNPETGLVNFSSGNLQQLLVWLSAFESKQSGIVNLKQLNEEQLELLTWMNIEQKQISRLHLTQVSELNAVLMENKLLAAILPWDMYEKLSEEVREQLLIDRKDTFFSWMNGRSYAISASSTFEEEAILWIQEMTDMNMQQQAYDRTGQLPTRASLYTTNGSDRFEPTKSPPVWWSHVFKEKQSEGNMALPDPLWPKRWQEWESMWELVFQDTLQMDLFINGIAAK